MNSPVASILAVALIGVVLWASSERAGRQQQCQFDEAEAAAYKAIMRHGALSARTHDLVLSRLDRTVAHEGESVPP